MRALQNLGYRSRSLFTAVAFLVVSLCAVTHASAQSDVIRGKVTDPNGDPVPAAKVTATSIPGNVTRSATTNGSGVFQISFPNGTGDYMMGYISFGFQYKQMEIKRLADEDVLIADAKLSIIELDAINANVSTAQKVNRNSTVPDVSGTERQLSSSDLPADLQGNLAAMAASMPGILLLPGLDGTPDAFSVLGLGGDQNSTTINGQQTGATNLPRDAQVGSSVSTSSYDASRGGFSGANINITPRSGSNFVTRGMSLVMTTPQMQWTDPAAHALGNDYTNISLGGIASGAIKLNKLFYNVSYQLGRQSRDNPTLLSTSPIGLQTAGVSTDSVSRFINILNLNGVPIGAAGRSNRLSDNGSLFGTFDLAPPNSLTGQAVNLTLNGSWGRQTAIGGGQLALASAAGDRKSFNGGIQTRHSGYFGMLLSETTLGMNFSHNSDDPYLTLPGGRVRVNSALDDGQSGVQSLSFGGNQGLGSSSSSNITSFMNSLSWFDNDNKHRLKLSTELNYNSSTTTQASNQLGTFTFNSLEDLQAGLPASYTRTLTEQHRHTGQLNAGLTIGDSYRKTRDLQFQYSVRGDLVHFTTSPQFNPLVESTFGVRNDHVHTPIVISPRAGFSLTLGKSNDIAAFTGAAVAPRAVLRGGVAVLANTNNFGSIGSAISNTGLPSGVQQIVCVGPATPIPDWTSYTTNPDAVPSTCADGTNGTVFSNGAPNVTLFAKNFTAQKSVRSNLSWSGAILDARFNATLNGTYSINLNQQRTVDLNFAPNSRFTIADDGRPVYVETTSIVPATGAIASRDARVSQDFARVSEVRSDLQSRSAQISLSLNPIDRTPKKFGWNLSYTYSNIREQVSGFSNTAGNPLDVEWARSAQGPHQFNYSLRYRFFNAVDVSWSGSVRSGSAYTPIVAGDINGDGYSNDRAFIYSQAASDPAVAAGMAQLLANSSGSTRDCLQKQLNSIAARNSCRGPWLSSASLNFSLDRAKFRMPQRGSIAFSVSNPLGAADMLVNGSNNLRGWGQSAFPDASLLYVRGFDPATHAYKYEVNQRFGQTRPQFVTFRSPTVLTASIKFDMGPTRENQQLYQYVDAGRTRSGSKMPEQFLRQIAGTSTVPNPLLPILRSQDSLHLTGKVADGIARLNRRYAIQADSIWTPVSRYLAALPAHYNHDEAYDRYVIARRAQIDLLLKIVPQVRAMLTPSQMRKLPPSVTNLLDPHYLALIRSGTGMYISTQSSYFAGLDSGGFGGEGFAIRF